MVGGRMKTKQGKTKQFPTREDKELAKEIEKRLGIPCRCLTQKEIKEILGQ